MNEYMNGAYLYGQNVPIHKRQKDQIYDFKMAHFITAII